MKIHFCHILIIFSLVSTIKGQTNNERFKIGIRSLCDGDTTSFLAAMNQCSKANVDSGLVVPALFELAGFYKASGDSRKALKYLHLALDKYNRNESVQYYQPDTCELFLEYIGWDYLITRGGILKEINRNYFNLNMYDSAIVTLNKIDIYRDLRFISCGNDEIMQRSQIAYLKAICYLGLHDTISAINQLLDYCLLLDGDGYGLSHQLLKQLLFDTYGKVIVLNEIVESLKSAKIVDTLMKSGVTNYEVDYYLFGRKMPYLSFRDIDDFKGYVMRTKFVLLLERG